MSCNIIRQRVAFYRAKASYSHRTFLPSQSSVGLCVCPVHCDKTVDRIWMRVGMVGRMGSGMRQGLGIAAPEGLILGANVRRPTVTMGSCGVAVRKCVNRQSCGLGWCVGYIGVSDGGPRYAREGQFFSLFWGVATGDAACSQITLGNLVTYSPGDIQTARECREETTHVNLKANFMVSNAVSLSSVAPQNSRIEFENNRNSRQ